MIHGLGLVIVAAGSSNRMQGTDKVWADLGGHSVVWHSLHSLGRLAQHTVVVVRDGLTETAGGELARFDPAPTIVTGGMNRKDSVARGLAALPPTTLVAVHDAARPFAEQSLLLRGTEMVQTCDGAIPALPVTDTIKQVTADGGVTLTLPRESLRSVQTPQVFRRDSLVIAHEREATPGEMATDDAALLEVCRYDVRVFQGQEGNFKITTEHDLRIARLLMGNGRTL